MSVLMLAAYVNIHVAAVAPTPAAAAPAALSVSASITSRPLLGGKATVHVTVKNTDTTNKAYNISLSDVFTSSRSPQGVVKFVSASDGDGALIPTSVNTTVATGQTGVTLTNIRDLAPQESYSFDVVVDLSGDATWQAGDLLNAAVTVGGNTIPNQTIPDIFASTSASAKVLPIIIKAKTVHQSTGVEQATGTGAARRYYYTIDVQNNYVGPTASVVVTDTIPDGVEYLGPHAPSVAPTSVSRDASTGVTTLVYNLGPLGAGVSQQLAYDTGIRYDFYGTDNGGKNRADATPITTATAGALVLSSSSVKRSFVNTATLGGIWASAAATDAAAASVTGAALTVAKSADKTSGGLGTVIAYTLTYATSQYFSAVATGGLTLVHDHVPDGQIFTTATANPAPLSVLHNPDGSTDVTWTVGAIPNTSGGTITFSTVVGTNWQEPSYAGDPIVSGDSMVNHVDISGVASDNVNAAKPNFPTTSADSVGFSTHLPTINKQMLDPTTHLWSQNVTMTVGDTSTVRVRFNTADGASALRTDINMGNIALTDWLPVGMSVVPNTFSVHYSGAGDFTLPTTGTPPPLNISTPTTTSIGGVQGVSWYLGNVAPAGWWEATFDVHIDDVPAVKDGVIVANLWKLTGVNTFGTPYSARDLAMVDYAAPHLWLTKSASLPSPLTGGSTVPYSLTISNLASGTAYQESIVDTLPVGERGTAPVVSSVKLDGVALADGTDYVKSWNAATGELAITLQQGAVQTPIHGGSVLKVDYTATLDAGVAANASLTNTATVGYATRPTPDGRVTPGTTNPADDNTDNYTIHPDGLKISKSGPSGPFTIGDVFGYDLDVTVPAHEIAYWPSVSDLLTREGFVPTGTPTIALQSGAPLVPASFANTATAPVRTTPVAGQTKLTFDLNDPIDNTTSNSAYVFRIHFNVQYTGLAAGNAWELQPPTVSGTATDTASVAWNSVPAASRLTNSSGSSAAVATTLGQPLLRNTKTITTPGPYYGGSTIGYQLVITNTGGSRAFDPSITDTLPASAVDATITSITLTSSSISTADVTSFVATPTMKFGFGSGISIGTTQTLTIRYNVKLSPSLGAGVSITNNSDVNWDSLPGAPGGSRVYNDSGQENWTNDTSSKTTNAAPATITKRGPAGPIRVGDVVTYSIDATVPANTIAWSPVFADNLSQRGLVYVSNSATITTRANPPAVPATLGGASTPTSTTSNPASTTLTWTLPAAIDNSGNNADYGFTLSFQVQVTANNLGTWEYWAATAGQSLTDSASFKWKDLASGGTQRTAVSLNTVTSVKQPLLQTTKTILTPGPLAGGSAFDYQVVIKNVGYNTAYNVSLADTMPAEVSAVSLASATTTMSGDVSAFATSDFSHLPTCSVSFDPASVSLEPGQQVVLVLHATLAPVVGAGATLVNAADSNWASLPGVVAGQRVYNDNGQEGATWTSDTTSVSTTTPLVTLGKSLPSGFTTATIGTSFPYSIVATIPANTTAFAMTLSDTVPASLTVLAALPSAGLPAAVVGAPTAAGTLVTVGPIDWPAAPSSSPTTVGLTLLCQVRDVKYGGGNVVSGTIANSAGISWNTRASGGSTLNATAGPVNFNVVEPHLTITKSALPTSAGPGDLVRFTSVLTNTGDSAAFAPSWNDVLPATMNNLTLVSAKESALPSLTAGTDYSWSSNGSQLTINLDQPSSPPIAPGESLTLVVQGTVAAGVHNGQSLIDTATVSSYSSLATTGSPARTYGPASAQATVTALSPALVTAKTIVGSAYPLPGDIVHFRYTVKNVGTAPAKPVVATDTLPPGLTYLPGSTVANSPWSGTTTADPTGGTGPTIAWPYVRLGAGETWTIDFGALVSASMATGTVVNTATAGGFDLAGGAIPANCSSWVTSDTDTLDSSSVPLRVVQPGVAVAKVLTSGDQFVQVGQKAGFKLTVTNTGDTTLTTVPLTDIYNMAQLQFSSASTAPDTAGGGALHWNNLGTLGPLASRSVNVTFTVLAQPAGGVATNNSAVSGAVDEFSHPLPITQDAATINVTRPSVSLTKTLHAGQDTTIQAGQTVAYDLVVTNSGDTTLTKVPLSDTFVPADLSFTTATVAPTSVSGPTASWSDLGSLAPGASKTVTVTFTAISTPAGNLSSDTARVTGAVDEHGDLPSDASASGSIAITKPSVAVTKALLSDPVIQVGQTATFLLNVTNTGDTTLTSIPLTDTWDGTALAPVSASGTALLTPNSATWTLAGPLAPGATAPVTLTCIALAVPSGQVTTDTAAVGPGTDLWDDPAPGDSSSASVRITHPAVSIDKSLHAGQDPVVQVGQSVTYDITVTNDGDTTLTTVPVTDTYDAAALTYVSASMTASSVAGGVVSWNNIGTLAPGGSRTITATFTARAVPSGQVTNDTAAVTGATDQYGDHPADDNHSASVRITHPAVTIVKVRSAGQDPQIQPGQTATFDLGITNTGDTTLATATVSDTWDPAIFSFGSAVPAADTTSSSGATWTLTSLAPGVTTTITVTLNAIGSQAALTTTDTAGVTGIDVYGDPAGPATSSATVMVTHPAITVLKSLSAGQDPQVQVGQTVTFDLRVTNTGNTPLATVPLSDAFNDAELAYTTATVAPTTASAGTLSWSNTGPIGVGATKVVTVTFQVVSQPAGRVSLDTVSTSNVKDIYGDPAPDASSTGSILITHPAILVTKTLISDPAIQAGQQAEFMISVLNAGDTTLTTVPMVDTWDSAVLQALWAAGTPPANYVPGALSWTNMGPLAPGAQNTVWVGMKALTNPAGQVTTNTVNITGATDEFGDHPQDATSTATVKVTHPAYTLTKTRVTDSAIQSSQTVTFDLTVHNTGDTTLTSVPLSDSWDSNYLAYFTSSLTPSSLSANSVAWDAAPIAPGASLTVEVTFVALQPVPGHTTVDHAAVTGATDENGDPATDATASDTVDITRPHVAITKQLAEGQDAHPQPGDPVTYTVVVTNDGDTTLTTVPVTDTYDATHLSFVDASPAVDSQTAGSVSWNNVGGLAPGEAATLTVNFTAETTGTAIVNSVITSGTDENGDPAPSAGATDTTLRITKPAVALTKTLHEGQDPQIQPGQTAAFDLTFTNTGDTTLTAESLSDSWDASVFSYFASSDTPDTIAGGSTAWSLSQTLAPGQSYTVSLTLLAKASPAALDTHDAASVSATDEFGDNARDASGADIKVTEPGVTVTKTRHEDQDPVIQVGQTVTYDLTVTNSGNTTLTSVPLSDTFDSTALSFAGASTAPDFQAPAGTLTWDNVGTLAPGASKTITVTFTATAVPTGQVTTDTAAVTGAKDLFADPAPDSTSAADVRITHPAVSVVKAVVPGQDPAIQAGQPATFTIAVTNTGDTTLTTVPLSDTFDSSVLSCTGSTPSMSGSLDGLCTWDNVGPLDPGQTTTVTISFVALAAAPGQATTNTATAERATDQYGDHPADDTSAATVKVTRPSLSLSKTLAPEQDLFIQTGQTVTFHLAVKNTGDTTLTAAPLSDTWDATYLQFASASTLPAEQHSGEASWTLGPIGPGDTASVDLTLIALGPIPGHITTDTASVAGAVDENNDPANGDLSTAAIAVTKPMVAITKALHDGQDTAIQVGQPVTYDIVVTNVGDVTLASVPVVDTFDSAVFAPASATPTFDSTASAQVNWTNVGPLAPGESTTLTAMFTAVGTSAREESVDTATVVGARDIHDDPAPNVSANAAELVTRPEVQVTKHLAEGQPTTVRLGSVVAYDVTATNSGDTTLTTVPLTDTFDSTQFAFVSALASPTIATTGSLSWSNVATTPLGPGQSVTTRVNLMAISAGNGLINSADISGATDVHEDVAPPAHGSDDALAVYDPASLDVTKTADPVAGTILLPGQVITYTLAWSNRGGVAMPGVIASDPLPDSVTYVPGSLKSGDTTLTDASDADGGSFDVSSRVVRVSLGDVGAETTGAVTFQVRVAPENVSAKGVLNSAYFISQEATVATAGPVYHPVDPITIFKTGRDVNGGSLMGGDQIEWKITVTNIGLTPTTHVVITDTVPNTTVYVNGSIRGKGANDAKRPLLTWDIGQMAVGETQVVTFRSTVKKGLPTGTRIRNQAVVSSDQSRPKKSDNPQTATKGDATILVARTSGSEDWRFPLGAGLLFVVAGMWLWPRRRRLALQPARRETSNLEAGDRDA